MQDSQGLGLQVKGVNAFYVALSLLCADVIHVLQAKASKGFPGGKVVPRLSKVDGLVPRELARGVAISLSSEKAHIIQSSQGQILTLTFKVLTTFKLSPLRSGAVAPYPCHSV
jgi:hypothetical protein